MKHFFSIKVTTTQESNRIKISNRTNFNAQVTGFSAVVDRLRIPKIKTVVSHVMRKAALMLYTLLPLKIVETKVSHETTQELRTIMRPSELWNAKMTVKLNAILNILRRFGTIDHCVTKISARAAIGLKIPFMPSRINIKTKHSLENLHTAQFYRLSKWDYIDPLGDLENEDNKTILGNIDGLVLSSMETQI